MTAGVVPGQAASAAAPPGMPTATASAPPRTGPSVTMAIVIAFSAVTVVLLSGLGGRVSNFVFPFVATAAAGALFLRNPAAYVSFTLWLWFVTPFVRRVLDMHHGWTPASPVLLAPLAAALLGTFTLLRRARELRGVLLAPFLLIASALAYGYAVGVINAGLIPATYALITWLAPVVFGVHVALHWRRYPEMAATMRSTFAWALPILAVYGLYQFARMPRWDALWMINSHLQSIGAPLPFLARLFGTLNTPGPYAAFLCAGALTLLPGRSRLRFAVIGLGMVALLLARTRAVWVAFIIGLVVQQVGQPLRRLPRYVMTLVAVSLIAIPVANIPVVHNLVAPRLKSFTDLQNDDSFISRYNFSEQAAATIVKTAEGYGLGMTGGAIKLRGMQGLESLDNGFLEVFYLFGWPGGLLFFLGVTGLVLQSFRFRATRLDPYANSARATAIALVSILPIGEVFTGSTGGLLWMSVGLGIAAHSYHLVTGAAVRTSVWRSRAAAPGVSLRPVGAPAPALLLDRPARG